MAHKSDRQFVLRDATAVVRNADIGFAAILDLDRDGRCPASIAFSTSSFTTEEGLSTTSPAAILSIVDFSRTAILFLTIDFLPLPVVH